MPKRVTLSIPGPDDDVANARALNEAAMKLSTIAVDGHVSINSGEAVFEPQQEEGKLGKRIISQSLTVVCDDSSFDEDVVNAVHAYLVSEFKVPDGTSIKTHIEDIDSYTVG